VRPEEVVSEQAVIGTYDRLNSALWVPAII
jgi:hypothetical protein